MTISHLKHEAASGVAKDGGGELQPEQDGEPRREQPSQVEVLPALGHHGGAREARERNGSPHKRCHQDAEEKQHTSNRVASVGAPKDKTFAEPEQQQQFNHKSLPL